MKPKIVCIGDSLTEGYGIDEIDCWASLLRRDLDIEIINSGISGDTTGGMLARFQHMVIEHKPSHVVIMGGHNDLYMNVPVDLILSNILAMTRQARYHGIVPVIGIPTPVSIHESLLPEDMSISQKTILERMEVFQQKLMQHITDDQQLFIDFSENMHSELFLIDGVHPKEDGHAVMAANAMKKLDLILV